MSDLLNKASLVMVPSGYKEDTVYSVVPTNGNGDLSFTRASNGTRINSAGLVEVCPWNLAQYSNTFSNGVWVTSGYGNLPTLTANSIANPVNGLVDAWTASFAAAGTQGRLLQTFTGLPVGVPYTYSMYVKAGTKTSVVIYADTASVGLNAAFNLSNGTITSTSGVTATITAMSNGWYFVTITNNILSSGNGQYGIVTNTGEDGSLYIYGAQLNIGSTAKPYFPTTDRLNVPRLTYQNGGGGCPSLLLEKQSTNLNTYSNDISNASYVYQNASVSGTTITSPDGTANAYGIVADTATNTFHRWYKSLGGFTGVRTTSIYAKKGTSRYCGIGYNQNGSTGINNIVVYDLETGVIASNPYSITASIVNVGNGWYRLFHTFDFGTGGTACDLCVHNAGLLSNYTAVDFQAIDSPSVSTTLYVWGVQIEASSYPTSYIPTTSSSATRVADACSKTGISSLIGQTEGVVFLDADVTYTAGVQLGNSTSGGDYVNSVQVAFGASSTNVNIFNGGTPQFSYAGSALTGRQKIAIAYKANDFALYINGAQIQVDSSGSIPTMSALTVNHQDLATTGYKFNEILLFKTRLTNAELASLTTI